MANPTERFSSRVENYIKYRPTYPTAAIDLLQEACGLRESSVIADIGSGTGISTELLLQRGYTVYGVEPNREMRQAAERLLAHYPNFLSIDGAAESTALPAGGIDLIVAAQAFHWFDLERTRREWKRILKPDGCAALLWNDRRTETTPFLVAYEALLQRFATDYNEVNHTCIDDSVISGFLRDYQFAAIENSQMFDYAGLEGRLLSSSYVPEQGHANYAPMLHELRRIFEAHAVKGKVSFDYFTTVYYGRVA